MKKLLSKQPINKEKNAAEITKSLLLEMDRNKKFVSNCKAEAYKKYSKELKKLRDLIKNTLDTYSSTNGFSYYVANNRALYLGNELIIELWESWYGWKDERITDLNAPEYFDEVVIKYMYITENKENWGWWRPSPFTNDENFVIHIANIIANIIDKNGLSDMVI